ncbi:unnamed protein product [Prorocentrum cordatum]|uniref:Uncharacterized protein n=1 Tax=Prorocentrum cordatum TaxID=2364126 RepID=A0ABN9RJ32_9DINO|nr:unnamed protein product [Polarella glacialis]
MFGFSLGAAVVAAVSGLQVTDPQDSMQLMGSRVVSALDPELTNTLGEKFHVTLPGEWNLIGIPRGFDPSDTGAADLVVNATIEDVGLKDCDDLLIRKVSVFGQKLGSNITSLEFSVGSDVFNETAAMGLIVNTPSGSTNATDDPAAFVQLVPQCQITRPRGPIAEPTKNSFRKRTKLFTAVCSLENGANVITVTWSTVWRGFNAGSVYYQNDLEVFVSGVGDDPAGLLGPDDHTEASRMVTGCFKPQPVNGPFQTRKKA